MRILVVNPNTTASMTASIDRCARAAASPGVIVDTVSPATGPASIESHYDEAVAVPGVLDLVSAGEAAGYDGYVIACFGDPGLAAARELARGPVVGIAEAAMRTAGFLGRSFSVVTTLSRTLGHSWDIARAYGVAERCVGMHASGLAVLELETDASAHQRIADTCRRVLDEDAADVIVLGCAGMADLAAELTMTLGVPVIDGVAAATAEVEMLVRLGLSTSKAGEFAHPHRHGLHLQASS